MFLFVVLMSLFRGSGYHQCFWVGRSVGRSICLCVYVVCAGVLVCSLVCVCVWLVRCLFLSELCLAVVCLLV